MRSLCIASSEQRSLHAFQFACVVLVTIPISSLNPSSHTISQPIGNRRRALEGRVTHWESIKLPSPHRSIYLTAPMAMSSRNVQSGSGRCLTSTPSHIRMRPHSLTYQIFKPQLRASVANPRPTRTNSFAPPSHIHPSLDYLSTKVALPRMETKRGPSLSP